MVSKVYGKINDQEIVLEKVDKDKWSIAVPRVKEGRYYIDLFALDDAGNSTFIATALFVVDANCCISRFSISDTKYKASFKTDSIRLKVVACICVTKKKQ